MDIHKLSKRDLTSYCSDTLLTYDVGHIFDGEDEQVLKEIFDRHPHTKYLHQGNYKVGVGATIEGYKTYEIIADRYTTQLKYKDALKGFKIPPTDRIKDGLRNALNQPEARYVEEVIEDYINTIEDIEHYSSYFHKSYFGKIRLSNETELNKWITFFKTTKLEYVRNASQDLYTNIQSEGTGKEYHRTLLQ